MLKLYEVTDEYIEFLNKYVNGVYLNKTADSAFSRKYVGPVLEIDGLEFYAPLSSPKDSDYNKGYIKKSVLPIFRLVDDEGVLLGTVRMSHMIPLISESIKGFNILEEEEISYRVLMLKQYDIIYKNESKIKKNAKALYKQRINQKKYFGTEIPAYIKNCLDFSELRKKTTHFTAYKNDLKRNVLKQVALEKKEFNKGNRFEEAAKDPLALDDMAVEGVSLNKIIQAELEKGKRSLTEQGIESIKVGYDDYEDEYYRPRRGVPRKVETVEEPQEETLSETGEVAENVDEQSEIVQDSNAEQSDIDNVVGEEEISEELEEIEIPKAPKEFSLDDFNPEDILNKDFDEEFPPDFFAKRREEARREVELAEAAFAAEQEAKERERLEALKAQVVVEEPKNKKKQPIEKSDVDYPEYSDDVIAKKLLAKRALMLTLRNKALKPASLVGSLFEHNGSLFEFLDIKPLKKVALLKDLTRKQIVIVIDFPKDGEISWSEERRFTLLWKANIEYVKL